MHHSDTPARLGKYRIDGILGEGAMGLVYRGYDPELDRPAAIKTLHKSLLSGPSGEEMLARFRREADAGIRLSHKHVVTVYEFGEDPQQVFMAMELIAGESLRQLNARRAPWPLLEAVSLAEQLLEALDFFHQRGVVHRDIKPANIMVDTTGTLTVTDFGIARTEASELTQVGTVLGTPSYMSPEQITGQPLDGRSDLFSVGVILYEMLTGERPFRGELITLAHSIVCTPHPDPSTRNARLPPAVDYLFQQALAKHPDERFRNGAAFRAALRDMVATILPRGDDAARDGVTIQLPGTDPRRPRAAADGSIAHRPSPTGPEIAAGEPAQVARPDAPETAAPAPPDQPASPGKRLFARCPKCGTRFSSPRPWNAICSGCGIALFEAATLAGAPLSGRARKPGGIALGWLIVIGVVALIVVAALLRR